MTNLRVWEKIAARPLGGDFGAPRPAKSLRNIPDITRLFQSQWGAKSADLDHFHIFSQTLRKFVILCFLLSIPLSCREAPPTEPRLANEDGPTSPNVLRTKTVGSQNESRLGLDPLGRLVPSADKLYGFDVPQKLRLVGEGPGVMNFELEAPTKAVTEFYTHRAYRVVKHLKGLEVSHTPETLSDQPKGVYDGATLFIVTTVPNKHILQFFSPSAPRNHISKLNDKVIEQRADISEKVREEKLQQLAQQRGDSDKSPQKHPSITEQLNPTRKIAPRPFNPGVPSNVGRKNVAPQIEQWLKDNPDKVFYD
ncbi:MAG: hypothetical protein HUU55_15045 [Myxococcales bacterium]|nr:hypothetical protein [Myxococcales bacterium]